MTKLLEKNWFEKLKNKVNLIYHSSYYELIKIQFNIFRYILGFTLSNFIFDGLSIYLYGCI